VLTLIKITQDNLPSIGDLITDPEDGAVGVVYDIRLKTYLVYWIHLQQDERVLDTKENPYSLESFRLIPT
jgi:hypothetical protein